MREICAVLLFLSLLVPLKIRPIRIRKIDGGEGKEAIQKFLCKQHL